jgi:3-isopropylmalate dehydratase small subunit
VDNVKALSEVEGTPIQQALIGTCTNGRLEDLRIAAQILDGKKIPAGFQLLVCPASKEIFLEAIAEGLITRMVNAGAVILSSSCGPCLGTGQGIPADGYNILSTANRNFLGRMGNKNSFVYLASPAAVAHSALKGAITDPRGYKANNKFPYQCDQSATVTISADDNRRLGTTWNYADVDNLNTDQMFAGNLTYKVLSSDPEAIMPYLFVDFDPNFTKNVKAGDVIIAGENFGCGSSREHPAVGLAHAGVKAVIVKSVNRIFSRSSVNQGLPIIVLPEVVNAYKPGDEVSLDMEKGIVTINGKEHSFPALPEALLEIFQAKGLVNWIQNN